MRKIKNIIIFTIICGIIQTFLYCPKTIYAATVSRGEYVLEINSMRSIHRLNENKKLPMASTTKILTAITVIENFPIEKVVSVPSSCVGTEGSSVYLREGERLTVEELLYGLLLRSGNDCAETLAATLGSGRSEFIALMNKTAEKCGAKNSNFTNPHGLHDDNHYTTAKDLCLIAAHAMKNPLFKKIVSTKRISISNDGYSYDRILINKNKMLSFYEGCNGVKTGYTKKAGRCLVSSVEKNGMSVVAVVINSPQMWERSAELMDEAFCNYEMKRLFSGEDLSDKIYYDESGKPFKLEADGYFDYPLKKDELGDIKILISGKTFENFIKKPEKNAIFEILLENNLLFSKNIYTII